MELDNVELMTVGDPDGRRINFTESDLAAIASSFDTLGLAGRVPLKFGHNDQQPLTDGQPAIGWVNKVWVEGKKLMAQFTDVPRVVYDLVKQGSYKFVSVELLRDVKAGTRAIPWVLDAVALLGADQPAFGTLKDLQALTLRRRATFSSRSRVQLQRAKFNITNLEDEGMNEQEVQALVDKSLATQRQDFNARIEKMDKEHKEALEKKDKEMKDERVKAHRNAADQKWNAAITAKIVEPAVRERFERRAKWTDDDRCLEVDLKEIDEEIKLFGKTPPSSVRKFTAASGAKVELTGTHQEKVKQATELKLQANGEKATDFAAKQRALFSVLRENPKLAKAYWDDPNGTSDAGTSDAGNEEAA